MADIIQIRRDTASRWATANPILADGEMGLEKDNSNIKIKIGDGIHPWNELKYISSGEFIINIDYVYPKQSGYYTKNEARNIVNQNQRMRGLIITYNVSATQRICEQYINSDITDWGLDSNWSPIGEKGDPGDILPSSIQADFTENDSTSPSFIQHKPDLSEYQKKIDENINFRSGENTVVTALNKVEDNTYDTNISSDYINTLGTISGSEYDEVTHMLGEGYRMPTLSEVNELLNTCTKTIITINDVQYCKLNNNENQEGVVYPLGKIWTADFVSNSSGKLVHTIELSENDSIANDSRCSNNYVIAVTRLQTEGFEDLGLSSGLRWGKYVLGASASNPSNGVKYPFAMHTATNGSWSEYLCLENECNTINDPLYPSSTDILHKDNTNKHISNADRERLLHIGNTRELPIPGQTIVEAIKKLNEKITNIPEPSRKHLLGGISVADLEALTDMEEGDIWAVFASGNEESGFSDADFTFNGIPCTAGTFIGYTNNQWLKYNDINLDEALIISPQQNELILPFNINNICKSVHTRSGFRQGLRIFDFYRYVLNENKYIRQTERDSSSLTDLYSVVIPFARYYEQGGEIHYEGGILSAADYERLIENEGSNIITSFPQIPLDTNVPSTKLVKDSLDEKAAISHTHTKNQITDFPVLAPVATSGAYRDLTGLPNIRLSVRLAEGTNLNNVIYDGMYYASEMDEIVNTPSDVERFGLIVLQTSTASSVVQILYAANGDRYERKADVFGVWSNWEKITDENIKFTSQSLTLAQQAQARQNIGASEVLAFDSTPTSGSTKPVTSGGVASALNGKSAVGHTHSEYASATTMREVISALNNYATKSLDNLSSVAGGNIVSTLSASNVESLLDKLTKDSSVGNTNYAYIVMSNYNGQGYKLSFQGFKNGLNLADVATSGDYFDLLNAPKKTYVSYEWNDNTQTKTATASSGDIDLQSLLPNARTKTTIFFNDINTTKNDVETFLRTHVLTTHYCYYDSEGNLNVYPGNLHYVVKIINTGNWGIEIGFNGSALKEFPYFSVEYISIVFDPII